MKALLWFMGFTIGALSVEVINQREKQALAVQDECAYHEARGGKLSLKVKDYPNGVQEIVPYIEEDSPQWDCKTMGNKKCGKK